jgi:hypothetical protein
MVARASESGLRKDGVTITAARTAEDLGRRLRAVRGGEQFPAVGWRGGGGGGGELLIEDIAIAGAEGRRVQNPRVELSLACYVGDALEKGGTRELRADASDVVNDTQHRERQAGRRSGRNCDFLDQLARWVEGQADGDARQRGGKCARTRRTRPRGTSGSWTRRHGAPPRRGDSPMIHSGVRRPQLGTRRSRPHGHGAEEVGIAVARQRGGSSMAEAGESTGRRVDAEEKTLDLVVSILVIEGCCTVQAGTHSGTKGDTNLAEMINGSSAAGDLLHGEIYDGGAAGDGVFVDVEGGYDVCGRGVWTRRTRVEPNGERIVRRRIRHKSAAREADCWAESSGGWVGPQAAEPMYQETAAASESVEQEGVLSERGGSN